MILVSACLCGINCRYNAKNAEDEGIKRLLADKAVLPVCPEQLGGLPTPRHPAEIKTGNGMDVIDGKAVVMDTFGCDVTKAFVNGAKETLKICGMFNIKEAILKNDSPSCGVSMIYDGSFSGVKKSGMGVTAALLVKNSIKVSAL